MGQKAIETAPSKVVCQQGLDDDGWRVPRKRGGKKYSVGYPRGGANSWYRN